MVFGQIFRSARPETVPLRHHFQENSCSLAAFPLALHSSSKELSGKCGQRPPLPLCLLHETKVEIFREVELRPLHNVYSIQYMVIWSSPPSRVHSRTTEERDAVSDAL